MLCFIAVFGRIPQLKKLEGPCLHRQAQNQAQRHQLHLLSPTALTVHHFSMNHHLAEQSAKKRSPSLDGCQQSPTNLL